MPNDKSPGNDGLTNELFETFWSEVKKTTFLSCILHSFGKEELCILQRQAIIKLKLYQNVSKMLFHHLFHIINLLMLKGDSLVKMDV